VTAAPAFFRIDAQRAWLYCKYGPESPCSAITRSHSNSTSLSRCEVRFAKITAPLPTCFAINSSGAPESSGLISASRARVRLSASPMTSLSSTTLPAFVLPFLPPI